MDSESSNYASLPLDKAELMQRIEREWAALQQAIDQLSAEQMSVADAGGWSIKDNLAHLAAWEHFLRHYHLRHLPPYEVMDVDKQAFENLDENGLNEILFQRHRARLAADVLAELRRSHEQVLTDLAEMSWADLMKPHYADDPDVRPLLAWVIGNTYAHYQEHRAAIEKLAKK